MTDKRYPDGKYRVFKKKEWDDWAQDEQEQTVFAHDLPTPIEDCVVIRLRDVFAAPALDAYANSIKIARDVLMRMGSAITQAEVERLNEIIDYFESQADQAYHTKNRKLPD